MGMHINQQMFAASIFHFEILNEAMRQGTSRVLQADEQSPKTGINRSAYLPLKDYGSNVLLS